MNVREPDQSFSDQLIKPVFNEYEKKHLLEQIELRIYENALPTKEDTIDNLLSKKKFLTDEIYPQLENFCVYTETYTNVINDIENYIQNNTVSISHPEQTENEDNILTLEQLRNKRLQYYKRT